MSTDSPPEADRLASTPHPRFNDVLYGQGQAERVFLDSFHSGRMHHAWLVTGPLGIGKATLAWRIAKFLLTDPSRESRSLATTPDHPALSRIRSLTDSSICLVRRTQDQKTGRLPKEITVGEIRNLISFFGYASADDRHRVAIIDSADELNESAANALLKLLEEPPPRTVFFLISHAPSMLLPTIRSRCATLLCRPLEKREFSLALEYLDIKGHERHAELAELAEGSVGEAVRILEGGGLEIYSQLVALFGTSPGFKRGAASAIASRCDSPAACRLTSRLTAILLRRLALEGLGGRHGVEAAPSEDSLLRKLSPDLKASREWASTFFELSRRAEAASRLNVEPYATVLEMLLSVDRKAREICGGVK